MRMTGRLVAGVDLGSTGIKVLIADEGGTQLLVRQRPTPWRDGPGGTTDLAAESLLETVAILLQDAAAELSEAVGSQRAGVEAIAISGMGETGVLVDADGSPVSRGFAWFDPRGREQIKALPTDLLTQFAGRTGLPVGAQVSVAKLLYLRENGVDLRGCRWFNLPEFVAAAMGAQPVSEYSLASRTGLLDQDSRRPWTELLHHLGVTDDFVPELAAAGTALGNATAPWLDKVFSGAKVTVAGYDHLVSAVSVGSIPGDRYHVSMGTAEVLLRVPAEPIGFEGREQLANQLINCVCHVVPGKQAVVAGVKSGLLMRRALQLSGVTDRAGRNNLDRLALSLPIEGVLAADAVDVSGARNDDGVLALKIRADGVNPAELFNAVLRHGNEELQLLIDALDDVLPPAQSTWLTGGWAGMKSVQRARALVLPNLEVSDRDQDTAHGAALFAARLLP
jgi:sugar (pentulose or hexulose) kinase